MPNLLFNMEIVKNYSSDFEGIILIRCKNQNPENVSEAIRIVRPIGVDTASGVELRPGKKDVGKLEIFLRKTKAEQL